MFSYCKIAFIFSILIYISFPITCFSLDYDVYDRQQELEKLRNEYGFSIDIPDEWTDPEYGYIVTDKDRLFTFLVDPPNSNDKKEKLSIFVKSSPSNSHNLTCTGHGLDEYIISGITEHAEFTPVDFLSGKPINAPAIKNSTFSGHRWFPPSIEPFYDSNSRELIGCQRDTAYKDGKYIIARSYLVLPDFLVSVTFIIHSKNYPKLVSSVKKMLDSIQIRCGDSWCKSNPHRAVLTK